MRGRTGRRAPRRDANEAEILRATSAIGAAHLQLDECDVLWGYRGVNLLAEIKRPGQRLQPHQEELQRTWPGQIAVVRSVEEALELLKKSIAMSITP